MKPLLAALNRQRTDSVPLWLMRQAGRYLPEYREVRSKYDCFMDLVYTPEAACEITMQPIRRFGMDGAIIFSDILTIPHALGRKVTFDNGPLLDPLESEKDINALMPEILEAKLGPVYEAISLTSERLMSEGFEQTALIGFTGAPWTLACYMLEGKTSRDFMQARLWAYRYQEIFDVLINKLEQAVITHLLAQIKAGAEIVQLFDSWAGVLDANQFKRWVISPTRRITDAVRQEYPDVKILGFPKGAGHLYQKYVQETGVDGVSLDSNVAPQWASRFLQPEAVIQGNLDPVCLMAGDDALELGIECILGNLASEAFIFNLGHGVHKDTPIEHVEHLCEIVRSWKT